MDDALTHGRYFFMNIMADGVLLLKVPDAPAFRRAAGPGTGRGPSGDPGRLRGLDTGALRRLELAAFAVSQGFDNEVTFELHQATEALYVLVRGRRADDRELVIPRDYIAYGFRARAQEAAQERFGEAEPGRDGAPCPGKDRG